MKAETWLQEVRALDLDLLARYGVQWGRSGKAGVEAVALPYVRDGEAKARKVRAVGEKRFWWTPTGVEHGLFNADCLKDETLLEHPVIVTEGEIDALSVIQAGFPRTVSLPDGWSGDARADNGKASALRAEADRLRRSPCIVVAGDNDPVGESFVRAAWNIFEGHPVRYVTWPAGCKDANDVLARHGAAEIVRCINAARWVDPPGGQITGFSDAPPAPAGKVYTTGYPVVDRVMCFHEGFPTVVTGVPTSGKSTFLTWAAWLAIRHHGIRVALSLMETPWTILQDHLAHLECGCPFEDVADKAGLQQKLDGDWRLLHRSGDGPHDVAWVRDMMRGAAVMHGCSVVVFDPWNELDHDVAKGEAVTDYTNSALAKIRQWAERYNCAAVVVAHPTKMQGAAGEKPRAPLGYDIGGSAAWYNKAAIGVTVHRDHDEDGSEVTRVINWKSKFRQIYPCRESTVRLEYDAGKMVYRHLP